MLLIQKFKKYYGSHLILKIDHLETEQGCFWVKGTNGSGKSTFLKVIAGILDFEGDILLDERLSIKKSPVEFRAAVNFAEAEPVFPGFLTGMEMIELFASAKNAPRKQEEYFIESMKMEEYINDSLSTYSSGMLKKLSLVLAFLGRPRLILLDEPLITIDAMSLDTLYTWIRETHKKTNVSFYLSSHQPLELKELVVNSILVQNQTVTKERE
jgi:ABC-2 type transport system ATP-binding protein